MKRGILIISLGLMFCIVGLGVPPVCAVPFDFYNITNNNATDAAIGEAQLSVDVTNPGYNQASFTFRNVGSEDCSITQIYFDGFLGIYFSDVAMGWGPSSDGVNFTAGPVSPENLPGGNTVDFEAEFGIGAVAPVAPNGVKPSDFLTIYLYSGQDPFLFGDLIANLETGETRIGIHVQGFDGGGSEGFITSEPVPEPATMLLMGCGLFGLGVIGRKKFLKRA